MGEEKSLEAFFINIPNTLLVKDGIQSLFFLLKRVLSDTFSSLLQCARKALEHIQTAIDKNTSFDYHEVVPLTLPFLIECMECENLEYKKHAAWVIAILAKKGHDVNAAIPIALSWLDSKNIILLQHATLILRNCSQIGCDISSVVSNLEKHLTDDDYTVRNYAAQAISNELMRAGFETEIQIVSNLFDNEELDSNYWRVDVHHRSYHAIDNTIMPRPRYAAHFQLLRMCGNCGHPDAYCIYFYDDSGTGWTDRISEFYCEECGKYTVYHYVD